MNRAELVARVAKAEQRVLEVGAARAAACDRVANLSETLNGLVNLRDKARAELAAMPEGPRRCWQIFSSRGRTIYTGASTEDEAKHCAETFGGTYCEMIEALPASEEVLEALKQSDFGCHGYCNVTALARELRARLPKGGA